MIGGLTNFVPFDGFAPPYISLHNNSYATHYKARLHLLYFLLDTISHILWEFPTLKAWATVEIKAPDLIFAIISRAFALHHLEKTPKPEL